MAQSLFLHSCKECHITADKIFQSTECVWSGISSNKRKLALLDKEQHPRLTAKGTFKVVTVKFLGSSTDKLGSGVK